MKKCLGFLVVFLLLSGCAAEETFETIADDLVQSVAAPMAQVILELPEDAVLPASENEEGQLYICDGYEILVQTMAAGNLDATLRSVTGYGREDLTLMQTNAGGIKRYDLVWSCLGENGDRVGRASILDDGSYHYVLSVLTDADRSQEYAEAFSKLFESYSLN